MYQIIDGKAHAQKREQLLKEKIAQLAKKPVLVSFLIGEDDASIRYTQIKQDKAQAIGIDFRVEKFPGAADFAEVSERLQELNDDPEVDGIMVQLPSLPGLSDLIAPKKDVDGLLRNSPYQSATVKGILSLLQDESIELKDQTIVVVGARGEVGSRLILALQKEGIEPIGVDRSTPSARTLIQKADILITSTGVHSLISGDMVKEGVVVIDVGSEKLADGKVKGDVDFESVAAKASKITPVPGGVGPMTVISLMENVIEATLKY